MGEPETACHALTKEDGYYILPEIITQQQAAEVRNYVLEHLDDGREVGPGDINLGELLTRDPMFERLVTAPRLLAVAHRLLGDDCKLSALTAKVLMPGCRSGGLHVDYPYWAMDTGMPVEPALMMQVIWMMQPFTEINGGTWIAPGSQKYREHVDQARFEKERIQATGNAGDAVISHGLLWHQTAINQSDEPRVAILINFSQLAIRPMREMGPFPDEFIEGLSDSMRNLLPLDYWGSLMNRLDRNYRQ